MSQHTYNNRITAFPIEMFHQNHLPFTVSLFFTKLLSSAFSSFLQMIEEAISALLAPGRTCLTTVDFPNNSKLKLNQPWLIEYLDLEPFGISRAAG